MNTPYTSAFMNSGAVSLDIHAPVRDVNFAKIVSFLIDNHNDCIAVAKAFAEGIQDAAWARTYAPRMADLSPLLVKAGSLSAAAATNPGTREGAAHNASWERNYAPHMKAMTDAERSLITMAMLTPGRTPGYTWDGWRDWTEAMRVAAVQELVDKMARIYIIHCYLTKYGKERIVPYRDILVKKIEETCFCA